MRITKKKGKENLAILVDKLEKILTAGRINLVALVDVMLDLNKKTQTAKRQLKRTNSETN